MKPIFPFTLIILIVLFNCCKKTAPTLISEKTRLADIGFCTAYSERTTVASGAHTKDSAWLQLPCSYYATVNASKKYPLIIFLNGSGEGSNEGNLNLMKKLGPPTFINDSIRFTFSVGTADSEFIIIAPQSQTGFRSPASTNAVIDYIINNYKVDASQIYLTGLSSGALGVFYYLTEKQEYANRIAAAVPMSAVTLDSTHQANLNFIANADVHIKSFCGIADTYYANNKRYIDAINSYKAGLATLVGYPGKHCCWNTIYNPSHDTYNPNMYEWMLTYHR